MKDMGQLSLCPDHGLCARAHAPETPLTGCPRLLQRLSHDAAAYSATAAALAAVLRLAHSADAPAAGSRSSALPAAAFPSACLSRDALQALCQSLVCCQLCHSGCCLKILGPDCRACTLLLTAEASTNMAIHKRQTAPQPITLSGRCVGTG